jgi:hypothetical protein
MKCKPSGSEYTGAYGGAGISDLVEGRCELRDGIKLTQDNVQYLCLSVETGLYFRLEKINEYLTI